jgi:hypothetical protein
MPIIHRAVSLPTPQGPFPATKYGSAQVRVPALVHAPQWLQQRVLSFRSTPRPSARSRKYLGSRLRPQPTSLHWLARFLNFTRDILAPNFRVRWERLVLWIRASAKLCARFVSHLFACPDVSPPAPLSTTQTPRLDHLSLVPFTARSCTLLTFATPYFLQCLKARSPLQSMVL